MEIALAGGVCLHPTPGFYHVANRARMLSPDGKCYSFDSRANGFVPGEGVGVVVLKRLRDAMRDGDHIHGVIVGSGVNQDGSSNGLIAPSGPAQERLARSIFDRFNIDPSTIQVLEAHGTGTLLGDAIELRAITRAMRGYSDRTQFCALGTVKTNIGHTGLAAGIAGVLKVLLALKHGSIPPSLHFQKANPAIGFDSSPFYVNTELTGWRTEGSDKRRAVISSFGFAGTNAQVVVEEAPAIAPVPVERPGYLIVLSARSSEQLRQQAGNLLLRLNDEPCLPLNDVSFTLVTGRTHLTHRLACVVSDHSQLRELLDQWVETGVSERVYTSELQEGKIREQATLKKFGNYCIRECRAGAGAENYPEYLAAIADLYVQGYALDFHDLFPEGSRRVPLPTYPFARERYWVDDGVGSKVRRSQALPDAKESRAVETRTPSAPVWLFLKENAMAGDGHGRAVAMSIEEKITLFLKQYAAVQLQRPIDDVPLDLSYFDLGLSSLGITNLVAETARLLDEDLSPSMLFEFTTIQRLVAHLAKTYPEKIGAVAIVKATAPSGGVTLSASVGLGDECAALEAEAAAASTDELLDQVFSHGTPVDDSFEQVTF
jgi:polyketide synthase PksN